MSWIKQDKESCYQVIKFLPQILIFASLGVIIYIFGRKIPKLREISRNKQTRIKERPEQKGKVGLAFSAIGQAAKGGFVWLAEGFVKRTKKLLHLVHFWLIKLKTGKKENDMLREIEAKQELIMEEEKSLEKVINEDLAQSEIDEMAIFKEEKTQQIVSEKEIFIARESTQEDVIVVSESPAQEQKIEQFFAQEEGLAASSETAESDLVKDFVAQEEPIKQSFFQKFWKKKPEPEWKDDIYNYPGENELIQSEVDPYMDGIIKKGEVTEGIVKIEKKPLAEAGDGRLIKEVVSVKRRGDEYDPDEELGIDRKILEKKLIQKIAKNPKDVENYRQLGELYIKMKEFLDAEESYKQILKLAPRDMDAKRKLEKIKLLKRLR